MTKYSERQRQYEGWYRELCWRVMDRAGGVCEACYKDQATQIHHLWYPIKRREEMRDLMALCDLCHYSMHHRSPANDNDEQLPMDLAS